MAQMPLFVLVAYLAAPFLIKYFRPRSLFADAVLILLVWLPVEFGWVRDWWFGPIEAACIVIIYHYLWPIATPWRLGWRLTLTKKEIGYAIQTTGVLALILVPLGIFLGFF